MATTNASDTHPGRAAPDLCLNCGTALLGAHCHRCGQSAHVHRSLGAIGHDLMHGVLHLEGKLWRTLPLLLFRPGTLTRRYAAGERARFVSPLALFLFIMFVLFGMLSVYGAYLHVPDTGAARPQLEASIASNARQVARLSERRARATSPAEIRRLDAAIADRREGTRMIDVALGASSTGRLEGLERVHTGWKRLDKGIAKAADNPNLILYKLQSNAYKFAWLLIPLSLPFLWLLFPFSRRFHAYDHAVFVTYSLCFVSLLVLVLGLLAMLGVATTPLVQIAAVVVPLHLYKQLRGAYAIGRLGALVRTILLFVGANVAIVLFVMLLAGLGLVG